MWFSLFIFVLVVLFVLALLFDDAGVCRCIINKEWV